MASEEATNRPKIPVSQVWLCQGWEESLLVKMRIAAVSLWVEMGQIVIALFREAPVSLQLVLRQATTQQKVILKWLRNVSTMTRHLSP